MAGLGLWDLVAPYFLLGVSPSEVQAALAALEVDDFESSSDELGAVNRGRARFAAGSGVYVDPVARAFGTCGAHPRDDPTRRDPWIDLADMASFTQWVNGYTLGRAELADFYFRRFRDEFKPAVDAWVATRPLKNPAAPPTPFAMPQYELQARAEAERLEGRQGRHRDPRPSRRSAGRRSLNSPSAIAQPRPCAKPCRQLA